VSDPKRPPAPRRPSGLELPFPGGLGWAPRAADPAPPAPAPIAPARTAREPASAPTPARPDERARPERAPAPEPPRPLTVAELDRRLKRVVEGATEEVNVEGEIAGLRVHSSGHAYFTLKDEAEEATIDCVMYRTAPVRSRKLLGDGARVVLVGRATVYVPRGRLQLVAELARPAGRGALLEALERLKEKLAGEGLFAVERKRPLPSDPRVVGVVTSGDGAAIHDIAKVAFRRGSARILLARAPVQGPAAAERMARAVALLARVPEVDVIVVGRGGGSAEDLAAFNDEALARVIAASPVPVVSAVGHEIDVTIADLVADARAATPSQAAELVIADAAARLDVLDHLEARLRRALAHGLRGHRAELAGLVAALGTPRPLLAESQQTLDEALARIRAAAVHVVAGRRTALQRLERRLAARHPRAVLAGARATLSPLGVRLAPAGRRRVDAARAALAGLTARLAASERERLDAAARALAARGPRARVRHRHRRERSRRARRGLGRPGRRAHGVRAPRHAARARARAARRGRGGGRRGRTSAR
jgi:exodeoxyribonuclease VII large subunit